MQIPHGVGVFLEENGERCMEDMPEEDVVEQAKELLRTISVDDQINFIRNKIQDGVIRCAICSSKDMDFYGQNNDLHWFSLNPEVVTQGQENRLCVASIMVCQDCGYMHHFSPQPILREKFQ